jgi:hypothetical protein
LVTESISEYGTRVHELRDLSAAFSELDTKVYEVAYPHCEFGLVYATPTTSTLVFDGVIDFSRLEQEALHWLPPMVFGRTLDIERDSLFSAIIFTRDGDIVEVEKDDPQGSWAGFHSWQRLMLHSETLKAARFDVALKSEADRFGEASYWYTFTADNPRYEDDNTGEISLQLPASSAWTARLVKWVIDHHARKKQLEGSVEVDVMADKLDRVGQSLWA